MEINTKLTSTIDYVYHLADIHFPKNIVSDEHVKRRYDVMMENIFAHIKSINYKKCVTVITGDLLNNNDQGSPDLIKTCIQFINRLGQYMPVIIIAGNHDYNHTTHRTWFDVLDAATNDNVHFLSESGFYILRSKCSNILIGFQAITDKYYSFFYNNQDIISAKKLYKCPRAIALFHGNVNGCKVKSKTWNYDENNYNDNSPNIDYNINKKWMKDYDLVLLGHIHERQKVEPNIYYAGSTIQRTFAESYDNHGGILFNIINKKHQYINYQDLYANVVLNEIDAKLHIDLPLHDESIKYILRIHHTDSLSIADRKEIEEYYTSHYDIVNITWQYSSSEKVTFIPQIQNVNDIFDSVIADFDLDVQEQLKNINSKHKTQTENNSKTSLYLQTLKWKNVFCYGDEISKIDFNNNNDITVISAPNTSGKSTIWRIILVALYADIDQRTVVTKLIDNIVNKNAKYGWIELCCNINNNNCVIKREFKINNTRNSHNYTITVNGIERDKTWLKDNLISYDVLLSNYSLTKDSESIYSKTIGKLQKYINDTFNLDTISELIDNTSQKINKLEINLKTDLARKEVIENKLSELAEINIDDKNNQIIEYKEELKLLHKPVNKYNKFSNISCNNGSFVEINITPYDYNEIVRYYRSKELNHNIVNIYNKDVEYICQLIDQINLSNKVKQYIANNNTKELAKLVNLPSNDLANYCWNKIQKYKSYVNTNININDNINLQECANYLASKIEIPTKNYNEIINLEFPEEIPDRIYNVYNVIKYEYNVNINIVIDDQKANLMDKIYEIYLACKNINCVIQDHIKEEIEFTENNVSGFMNKIKFNLVNVRNTKLNKDLDTVKNALKKNPLNFDSLTRDDLIALLQVCLNILLDICHRDDCVKKLRDNSEMISSVYDYFNNVYTYCIIYINEYNKYALQQNSILWNYHVYNISRYYKYLQQIVEQNAYIIECSKKLICNVSQYTEYNKIKERIYKWCQNICYTITDEYNKYDNEFEQYSHHRIDLTSKITQLENDIHHYEISLNNNTKLLEDLTCKCITNENDIDINKKYKLSLENTRIQIIKNGLKALERNINNELETYIQYHIQIALKESTNKTGQFTINIKHQQSGQIICYDNLSGYEKAIVQFVTMHIINSFSSHIFNMFYIDEAFDVFDDHNFNKYISQLLQIAADYSQNVLFVTHRTLPTSTYIIKTIEHLPNGGSILV